MCSLAAFCVGLHLICSSRLQRWRSFSERFSPWMIMPEKLQTEQSSCSFSRDNKKAVTSSYYKNTETTDLKNKLKCWEACRFFRKLSLKIPLNLTFSSATYQKPWMGHSRYISANVSYPYFSAKNATVTAYLLESTQARFKKFCLQFYNSCMFGIVQN